MPQTVALRLYVLLFFLVSSIANSADFEEPSAILRTEDAIGFAFNTRGSLAVDSRDHACAAYYIADDVSKPPQNRIWLIDISGGDPSSPVRIDHAPTGGGRHPKIAFDAAGILHAVWQDYRHVTAGGNYIDNVEIFYNRRPTGGVFPSEDIRISHTNAGHKGDNGFLPQIAIGANGRVHIAWYDFTASGNNAEIYLRSSGGAGEFPDQIGIDNFRVTTIDSADDLVSHWMPDAAALPGGEVYIVWGVQQGFQGIFPLQGRSIAQDRTLGAIETIAEQGGSFLDPPRLAADKVGNLGLIYTIRSEGMNSICFQYRPREGVWSNPAFINETGADSSQPCLAFDMNGTVHLVWQEDMGGIYQVRYALLDPTDFTIRSRKPLSLKNADARTPAIAINPITDRIHCAWIERNDEGERTIVYLREQETKVEDWRLFD
ncbi:MAG: hypothetical protein AB1656_25125 [Candidatus Omnitrophota bacterium]